jgi:hypothetical protein
MQLPVLVAFSGLDMACGAHLRRRRLRCSPPPRGIELVYRVYIHPMVGCDDDSPTAPTSVAVAGGLSGLLHFF